MIVRVSAHDVQTTFQSHGTTAAVTGTDERSRRVRFVGDWRAMRNMADGALQAEGAVSVSIAKWQIYSIL